MHRILRILRTVALILLATVACVRADEVKLEIIESLTVGSITYTNVQLMNRTKSDVFIKHAGGVINIKIKDLDKSTQLQLGYHLADPSSTNGVEETRGALTDITVDPRLEELTEQVIWESQEFLRKTNRKTLYAAGGVVFAVYLFFCWCCRLICLKTGQTRVFLSWLPLFKQVPLLRAAGMSPWWILSNLVPPVFCVAYIVWAFKISKARGKGLLTGVMLLVPLFNVLAFLYLALADRLESDSDESDGRLVSLHQPRRPAA
ncbi:MAG: hypothetical protein QOF48_2619 [Verrucomicrobiota bacterium]|jgi:hypothetical protein